MARGENPICQAICPVTKFKSQSTLRTGEVVDAVGVRRGESNVLAGIGEGARVGSKWIRIIRGKTRSRVNPKFRV